MAEINQALRSAVRPGYSSAQVAERSSSRMTSILHREAMMTIV